MIVKILINAILVYKITKINYIASSYKPAVFTTLNKILIQRINHHNLLAQQACWLKS